jgi:uncharacterized protein (DUF58 family)
MLPAEVFKQVRQVHIRTRRLVDGIFAGEYHSVFKGRGIEFAEVREYSPGDDVRTIDWNVTARTGQPFVKQYVEERELTVMLLVDCSASGQFGSSARIKMQVASELCAVLALSAISNNDKVGLILFTDQVEHFVPPRKGKNRALRLSRDLLFFEPKHKGTNIASSLEYLHKVLPRHSISFLVSDFFGGDYEKPLRIASKRHEIVPICITDQRDYELPPVGFVRLTDLETGKEVLVDTDSEAVRQQFRDSREKARVARNRLFSSLGIDPIEVQTDQPYVRPLMRFFKHRQRRLREGR